MDLTNHVNIRYFAIFRELAGRESESLPLGDYETAGKLFKDLAQKYNFPLKTSDIRVAINDEFESFETKLNADDQVVFIPPVSGG